MTSDERKIGRRQLIAVGVSVLTLGASIAGFAQAAHPGDTPVVLIGGTVTVKVGSKDNGKKWKRKSGKYHAKPAFPIALIVLKNSAQDDQDNDHKADDDDPSTDQPQHRIDVSSAGSWKVDVFALATDSSPIISITSGSDIQLALVNASGALCKDTNRRTAYSTDQGCTAAGKRGATFAKAVVTVDGTVPQNGTLSCAASGPGKCRIVFRYPSVP
jgi:hypothetical protein